MVDNVVVLPADTSLGMGRVSITCAAVFRRLCGVPRTRRRLETADASADADQFLVHELVDAEPAQLAAEAGPLHTAERQFDAVGADHVDVHHSGLDPVGDPLGLFLIGGEHVGPSPNGVSLASFTASSSEATL